MEKIITHSSGRCGDGCDVNCTPKVGHKTFGVQFITGVRDFFLFTPCEREQAVIIATWL